MINNTITADKYQYAVYAYGHFVANLNILSILFIADVNTTYKSAVADCVVQGLIYSRQNTYQDMVNYAYENNCNYIAILPTSVKLSSNIQGYIFNIKYSILLENDFSPENIGKGVDYTPDQISNFTSEDVSSISIASMMLLGPDKLKYFKPAIFSLISDRIIFYTNPSIFKLSLWPDELGKIIKNKWWYYYLLTFLNLDIPYGVLRPCQKRTIVVNSSKEIRV
jgi:hypothetical protein